MRKMLETLSGYSAFAPVIEVIGLLYITKADVLLRVTTRLLEISLLTIKMTGKVPSGAEKKRLQEQLDCIEFVRSPDELQEFKCNFCHKIALERHVVECGHRFCSKCSDDVIGKACPVDNCYNTLIKTSTRNADSDAVLYSLEVHCRRSRLGCNIKIPLYSYLAHESNCPFAVEMAEASENVIRNMRADIDELKRIIINLQGNVTRNEESLKMNLYEERIIKTDLQIMEGKLNDIISQKMKIESGKIEEKCAGEFQRIAKEQAALCAQVEKNFAIQQNQELGLEKHEIEKYIKDQISDECTKGMREFQKDVTEMITNYASKQESDLKAVIMDELIGRLAIKELDLECKMKNWFDEKFKLVSENMERKIEAKFDQQTAANKVSFQQWCDKTLNAKMQAMEKDFDKKFRLFLKEKFLVYKEELSDVMLEDVNDKLDECTRSLITNINNELEEKIEVQKQFLLRTLRQEIRVKSEQYKTDVQSQVDNHMLDELATQKEDLETHFLNYINEKMRETEDEFGAHFSDQINVNIDEQFQELHSTLTDEFNNEIALMQGHIQEQYETDVNLGKTIEALDTNYLGKTGFLLEKYSTAFVWPISNFVEKVNMLRSGAIDEVESDSFNVKECKMLMKAKLTWRNNSVLLMLTFMPSEQPRSVYYHRRSVWLLDQRQAVGDRKHRVRVEEPHFGTTMGGWMDEFCPLGTQLFPTLEELSRCHFMKDGTVLLKILIEPLAILYKSMGSSNGVLVWKIENVSRLVQDEKSGVVENIASPYFYSSPNGYRMQLAMYFSSVFVSVYLHFLTGQFDEFLSITFPHRTTFMVLDQSDSTEKKHLKSAPIISRDMYADYVTNFVPRANILGTSVTHSVVDPPNPLYLRDDTILVKVVVEPLDDCTFVDTH